MLCGFVIFVVITCIIISIDSDGLDTMSDTEYNLNVAIYALYGFVGLCAVFAIIVKIHQCIYWPLADVDFGAPISFAMETLDFYSDIVFSIELFTNNYKVLFYVSASFLVISWIANIITLSKYKNAWCTDDTLRERTYQWFISWNRMTYFLTMLSGSIYGVMDLASWSAFGLDFFCLRLNARHMKRFSNSRLYAQLLAEDIPEIIIQFVYISMNNWSVDSNIVWVAMSITIYETISALFDIYSSNKLFKVLDQHGFTGECVTFSMWIISKQVKDNSKMFKISAGELSDVITEILTVHPRSVEVAFPIETANGFKVKFTLFCRLDAKTVYEKLKSSHDELVPGIQQAWRLTDAPNIPLNKIKMDGIEYIEDVQDTKVDGNTINNTNNITMDELNVQIAINEVQQQQI